MFKRSLLLVSLILTNFSIVYPNSGVNIVKSGRDQILKSRIIITGKSSIIIESKDNNTNIIAGKIETVLGGKLKRTAIQDDDIDIYKQFNKNSETVAEASASFGEGIPTEFTIEKAYPNPFNPTTRIRYGVSTVTPVNVVIYDMTGRLVSNYKIGDKAPGWHEFTWQGTDTYGQQVSTGVYLITMRAGGKFQKQKVTFLK